MTIINKKRIQTWLTELPYEAPEKIILEMIIKFSEEKYKEKKISNEKINDYIYPH